MARVCATAAPAKRFGGDVHPLAIAESVGEKDA